MKTQAGYQLLFNENILILTAKPEWLCGCQQEGRMKGMGDRVLKLNVLEHWRVQIFADEPEPLAEMFLLPHAAA